MTEGGLCINMKYTIIYVKLVKHFLSIVHYMGTKAKDSGGYMAELGIHYSAQGVPKHLFCLPASDEERKLILSIPGARPQGKSDEIRFNPDVFVVRDTQRTLGDRLTLHKDVTNWYQQTAEEHRRLLGISQMNDVTLPTIVSQQLRNYQRVGAHWLANSKIALLGDDMGLGKSFTALAATRIIDAKSILIVTLAISKWQWQDEIAHWLGEEAVVVDGSELQRKELINNRPKYIIINYDILRSALTTPATKTRPSKPAAFPDLVRRAWDVVIFDEAHKLQGRNSQQSSAAEAVARRAKHVFELTGTPIWNMQDSLWHLLHVLDPQVLSSYWTFVDKYCLTDDTLWGKKVVGINPRMLPELQERLSRYVLQRKKKDVAPELPEKIYTVIPYKLSERQEVEYRRIKDELRIEYIKGEKHFSNAVSAAVALRKLCNNPRELGLNHDSPKDKVLVDLVENMLLQKDKLTILCWHRDYVLHIKELLEAKNIKCALGTGAEQAQKRILTINKFKEDPDARVLIGTIGAIGTALNLGYMTDVIFAELDWTPPMNKQAEDRFHRLTSTETVNIYYLIGRGTIEQHILEVTQRKSHIAEETLAIQDVIQAILTIAS